MGSLPPGVGKQVAQLISEGRREEARSLIAAQPGIDELHVRAYDLVLAGRVEDAAALLISQPGIDPVAAQRINLTFARAVERRHWAQVMTRRVRGLFGGAVLALLAALAVVGVARVIAPGLPHGAVSALIAVVVFLAIVMGAFVGGWKLFGGD
jgi:hypothetical protein